MKLSLLSMLSAVFLLTTVCQAQNAKQPSINDQFPGIDSVLNRILKDQHVAGFSVAIVKGKDVIYSKGFGYRDVQNKKPVTPNTLFAIGSSSKAFTSSLIGLLRNDGKLSFEDLATTHLPQLRFYSEEMNSQITIRDLMSHRSGLSRYDYSWLLFNTSNRDSIIGRVKYMQPTAPVRQKWLYNNFMFLAQGMIVEKMTGKTWEQNIQEKFFDPLKMTRSNTNIKTFEQDSDAALPYMTVKDSLNKKIDYYNINGMGPAGSINSSATDMANWLKVWISGGRFEGKEILPNQYVGEAASSQMVMDGGLPSKHKDIYLSNYGLGWMLSSYRGHYLVEHGGNINGFSASVGFFPTEEIGIVVLTNQNGSAVPDLVRNSIADRILALKPIDWNAEAVAGAKAAKAMAKQQNDDKVKKVANTKPSHPLKDYVGAYENPAYGIVHISLPKEELLASFGSEKAVLKHFHYDVFDPRSIEKNGDIDTTQSKVLFSFAGNQEGKIADLTIQLDPDRKPVVFSLKPVVKVLPMKELEQYVGEYVLGAMTTKVYLKGNTLFVFVPGQPEYETVPTEKNTFALKMLKGFSVKFNVVGDGKASSASFIQPNGTFKAERKK